MSIDFKGSSKAAKRKAEAIRELDNLTLIQRSSPFLPECFGSVHLDPKGDARLLILLRREPYTLSALLNQCDGQLLENDAKFCELLCYHAWD